MTYPERGLPFDRLTTIDERVDFVHDQVDAVQSALNQLLKKEGLPAMAVITRDVNLRVTLLPNTGQRITRPSPLTGRIVQLIPHWPDGCLLPDTPILMEDGTEKAIQKVSQGERVLCHRSYGEVIDVSEIEYSGEIITFKPRGLDPVSATPNHRVLAIPMGEVVGCGGRAIIPDGSMWPKYKEKPTWEPKWLPIGDLKAGDWGVSPIYDKVDNIEKLDITEFIGFKGYSKDDVWGEYNEEHLRWGATGHRQQELGEDELRYKSAWNTVPRYITLSPGFMRLLGLYLAECNLVHEKYHTPYEEPVGINFTFGGHEKQLANECSLLLKECFGIAGHVRERPDKNSIEVSLRSVPIALLFQKLCGEHSDGKFIHPIIMQQKPELQWHLVNALHDGDNSDGRGRKGITLKNPNLINQVATILNRLQLKPAVAKSGKTKVVSWRTEAHNKNRFYLNHWLVTPIRKVSRSYYKGYVYNLGIKPYESYVAGKVAVHNCNALVDIAVGHKDTWVYPNTVDTYVALNDATPVLTIDEPIEKGEELWMIARNADGVNQHAISCAVTIIGVG